MNARENMIAAYKGDQPEWVPNGFTEVDLWFSLGERYFGEGAGDDWFGVNWTHTPELGSQTETPGQEVIEDLEDWREKIFIPDLDTFDWQTIAAEETKGWDRQNRMSLCMFLEGPFERLMSLMGFENAMCAFYDTPDEIHEFFEALTEYKCKYLKIMKEYFDFDIIAYHDDWGNNQNMFFSMDMWREFIKPYIQKVIDCTHELGMIFEMHSCGYIKPTIGELVEMGIDALQPLQYCNDVEEVKTQYGDKILINGGFDAQGVLEHPNSSEADIRDSVRKTLDELAVNGRFVASYPIIDSKVAEIVIDEIETYGKAFYKNK